MAPALSGRAGSEEPPGKSDFFIAGRLRGIPLVSHGSEPKKVGINSDATGDKMRNSSAILAESQAGDRLNQVEKRDAPGEKVESGGILFKQTGSTSSITNWIRSTTRKPSKQQAKPMATQRPAVIRSTTTRRSPTTTTTRRTTRRPTATTTTTRRSGGQILAARGAAGSASAKLIRAEVERPTTTTISSTTSAPLPPVRMSIEPISSVKMSTLEAAANSLQSDSGGPTSPYLIAATTASSAQQQQQQQLFERTTLTKSMQTLTTQPVNQRRNQQNVIVQSRGGSNRLGLQDGRNGYAGPNWYLFNRPDGSFSVFEILVLVSNMLIVCTIILVILINWIKMFKRRKRAQGGEPAETRPKQTPSEVPVAEPSAGPERLSKASPVSSLATSMATSAMDGFTTTTGTSASHLASNGFGKLEEGAHRADGNLVGDAQRIASEFNQAGAKVANKAVAIVKSIENNLDSSVDSPDKLKVKAAELAAGNGIGRSISRSVSDLTPTSGTSPNRPPAVQDEAALQLRASANTTPERVDNLEKLFRGESNKAARSQQQLTEQKAGQGQQQAVLQSSNSLESIELPNNLLESMKRTAAGPLRAAQMDEAQTRPSPNLLLGQVEEAKVELPNGSSEQKEAKLGEEETVRIAANPDDTSADRPGNPHMSEVGNGAAPPAASQSQETANKQPPASKPATGPLDKESSKRGVARAEPKAKSQAAGKEQQPEAQAEAPAGSDAKQQNNQRDKQQNGQPAVRQTADVKNHQVVVNRLDKRKTNLEIVDLRDASVTGKMPSIEGDPKEQEGDGSAWISMDGVAVVQPRSMAPSSPPAADLQGGSQLSQQAAADQQTASGASQVMAAAMSPSEIIESRFHVDYKSKRRQEKAAAMASEGAEGAAARQAVKNSESMDSKQEEYVFNNIESELELDNKMRNRKYFVYVVHDGHFTARKECIARIELPPKRRITLAELRQLIASSQDVSLSSLRRNRFKFVTETYRLLNENEDAAVLHQVYPTQGVFLKLNVSEQENQVYPFKGGRSARLNSGGAGGAGGLGSSSAQGGSSLSNTTIASRRRANARPGTIRGGARDGALPAIEVNNYGTRSKTRASSVGRTKQAGAGGGAYRRSKSSVQMGRTNRGDGMRRGQSGTDLSGPDDILPPIGTSHKVIGGGQRGASSAPRSGAQRSSNPTSKQTIGGAASDLGANVISGAKKLLSTTFGL